MNRDATMRTPPIKRRCHAITALVLVALTVGCAGDVAERAPEAAPANVPPADTEAEAPPKTLADIRERIVAELMRGIDHPDVIVDREYVTAVADAWSSARSSRSNATGRGITTLGPILREEEREVIGSRLHAALPRKRGAALLPALTSAVRLGHTARPQFRDAALRSWADADSGTRQWLLSDQWEALRGPEFEPLLRHELATRIERPTPWHVRDLPTLALLRLHDLRPAEARRVILADIARKQPLYGGAALTVLDDSQLAEVEANFRRPLTEIARWSFDLHKHGRLAERYGGADALAAARAILDQPEQRWNAALIRIVMSQDRVAGFARLKSALAARDSAPPSARRLVLERVLSRDYSIPNKYSLSKNYWGPDAEALVRTYADDADPRVRTTVARLLANARPSGRTTGD